jgi:N-acetylglucosaminyldiphosphoundecaprenol N-acetyl-beta-D-mannosaminyltransferase
VLGVPIARLDFGGILDVVAQAIEGATTSPFLVSYANAHTCNLARSDARFRDALARMNLIYLDGNGPRLAAYLAGEHLPHRMTGADWIDDLCAMCAREGASLYFLGSAPGVAEEARRRLERRHPGLRVLGTHHGFGPPDEGAGVVEEINRLGPDIVIVGMGSPRQEIWMAGTGRHLRTAVVWAAGGVLDYASGRLRRAPRWMLRLGLEWLGRALIEPGRLGPRYLLGTPRFVLSALRHGVRKRLG